MINYATEFPISNSKDVCDVLNVAIKWIKGSPHTRLPIDKLQCPTKHGEHKISFGAESIHIGIVEHQGYLIGGLRWKQIDASNLEWTSVVVAQKTADKALVSIQVSCEALSSAALLPLPKKPIIISRIIQDLGGGMDGHIPITDKPFQLDDGEADIAAALIQGTGNNRLPIIYVSASFDGRHIVNPTSLAKAVSGLAHVVIEPSKAFSLNLKKITAGRNVYGGTIGVYWPDSNMRKVYYIDDISTTCECIQNKILNDIRIILTHRRSTPTCTWVHFQEAIASSNYRTLKADSTAADELLSGAEQQINASFARIKEQEQEIANLYSEIKRVNALLQAPSSIISHGEEQEFFEGEARDIALKAIEASRQSALPGSRRAHMLEDMLKANPQVGGAERFSSQVKTLLRSYVEMDAKTRSALERLGFVISEDGKHYKAIFRNDPRYTFAISKSASDHRSGKNMASDINKKLF